MRRKRTKCPIPIWRDAGVATVIFQGLGVTPDEVSVEWVEETGEVDCWVQVGMNVGIVIVER